MGYRIEYDMGIGKFEVRENRKDKFPVLVAGAFVLFLLLTWSLWPEGAEVLRDILIPGDNAVTVQAMKDMSHNLKNGVALSDAVTAFCQDVIQGAELED